jgi:disulfide bond formation protein DsbB
MSEETIRLGRERRFLVLLGIICLALIGGALYMQIVLGEAPCPLCILQRYALLLIALFAFIGAAMRTRRSITVFEAGGDLRDRRCRCRRASCTPSSIRR